MIPGASKARAVLARVAARGADGVLVVRRDLGESADSPEVISLPHSSGPSGIAVGREVDECPDDSPLITNWEAVRRGRR